MRFDDRLATALGQPAESPAARQVAWRQLVDLLGQAAAEKSPLRTEALERLREWRVQVPVANRQHAALLLDGRKLPRDLVAFFAEDLTIVSAPFLAIAEMAGEDWVELIPRISPVARALLRHRRDLPKKARRALALFEAGDMVLSAPAGHVTQPETERRPEPQADATELLPVTREFEFETDADGSIRWCHSPTRGALLGISIAHPAAPGSSGVDGQAAGAFRRRAAFRDARLLLIHGGAVAGDWSISAVPVFDPPSGRFTGYRGTARRPHVGERAEPLGLLGSTLTGDSLRQLTHEVRTPLNAIAGFAEMIEQQLLGPAAAPYRDRAANILMETQRIQQVLDELEDAAQAVGRAGEATPEPVDCAQLLARVTGALKPLAEERGVLIALVIAPRCKSALLDPTSAERMTTRLLSAVIGMGCKGEELQVRVSPADGEHPETWVAISRPACIADHDEHRLLDAAQPDDDHGAAASPLGLGFTLRLVRSVAESCGGKLAFTSECFRLRLPSVASGHGLGQGIDKDWSHPGQRTAAACNGKAGSAIAPGPGGACSSTVELAAHNGLVGGSNPSGPTAQPPRP